MPGSKFPRNEDTENAYLPTHVANEDKSMFEVWEVYSGRVPASIQQQLKITNVYQQDIDKNEQMQDDNVGPDTGNDSNEGLDAANLKSSPETIPFTPPRTTQSYFLAKKNSGGKSGYVATPNVSPKTCSILEKKAGSPLTPIYNEDGSPTKASTPNGSELRRSMKTSDVHVYAEAADSPKHCSYNKKCPSSDEAAPFLPLTRYSGTIVLDQDRLDEFLGVRRGWKPTQGQAMGMSAKQAAIAAGVDVQGEDFHWLHLFAFSMGGLDGDQPNEQQNLILGTAAANGHHLRVEDTIKNLVSEHRQIYVRYSMDPDQEVFDAKWHLCGQFTYEFGLVDEKSAKEYAEGKIEADQITGKDLGSITIETLKTNYPHSTDQRFIQAAAVAKLERWQPPPIRRLEFLDS